LLLETFEDMIRIYQPHVVRLAHARGVSIDLVASFLTENGSLRSDRTDKKVEVLKVPARSLRNRVSADAVVKISNNLGTFSMLPPAVLKVVMENLASTYASKKQAVSRRAQAAFEYAIGSVSLLISEDSRSSGHDIAESLAMIQYAAEHDHHNAQFLAPWLGTTLRQKSLSSQVEPQTINRLTNGVLLGSRIAMRQLKKHDPVAYDVAIQSLRTRYRGLGMFTEPEVANWATPAPYNADPESPERLWISSSRGDTAGLRQIVGALSCKGRGGLPFWLNEAYFDDYATPLLEACRSGHKEAVRLLLEYGADASMVDRNGVSPLHFLSSFEPNDMLGIAQELLKHGAILDSWTLRPCYDRVGGVGLDQLYGQVSGTPLLWAVAADCIDAVRVLLEMGADPFAVRPPDVVANSHFYPVLLAARFHQSRILALLLRNVPKEEIAKNLNSREDETKAGIGGMSPLGYACLYGGGQVLARILLHGPHHIERCAETIHLLLDLGADPVLASSQDHGFSSAFGISARSPQTYALRALLQWNHGAHKPDLEEWIQALVYSAYWNGQAMFDELIEIDVNLGDKYSWSTIAREVSARTNNTHYFKAIASKQKGKSGSQGKNHTFAFVAAVMEGNFDTARTVYEQHKSDIDLIWAQPLDDINEKRKISILGQLIRIAKSTPNRTPNLAFFLDLVGPRDEIFERVIEAEDGSSPINALQFVVIYAFDQGALSAGTVALRALLKHFYDPSKHLVCQEGDQRGSLLHQAVHDGNYAALDVLLTTDGMNFDFRNHLGMTAFDVCLTRWQDSSRDTNHDFNNALKKGRSRAWAEKQWQTATEHMMRSMEEKGASKYGEYSHCSKRISESEAMIITLLPTGHIVRTKHSESHCTPVLIMLTS
jgi:ankyrin repeat protein